MYVLAADDCAVDGVTHGTARAVVGGAADGKGQSVSAHQQRTKRRAWRARHARSGSAAKRMVYTTLVLDGVLAA